MVSAVPIRCTRGRGRNHPPEGPAENANAGMMLNPIVNCQQKDAFVIKCKHFSVVFGG